MIGSTGVIWLDGDGDGRRTTALDYARRLTKMHGQSTAKLVDSLTDYDEAIAIQVAALLNARGISMDDQEVRAALKLADSHVERGFRAFFDAWRK